MKKHNHLKLASLALMFASLAAPAAAQDTLNPWTRQRMQIDANAPQHLHWLAAYESFSLDFASMKAQLAAAPLEGSRSFGAFSVLSLPTPEGGIQRFKLQESPIMTPALASTITARTYRVVGIDDQSAYGRLDIGVNGFHGFVRRNGVSYFIDPMTIGDQRRYVVYRRTDNEQPRTFACFTEGVEPNLLGARGAGRLGPLGPGDNRKTYRLAMNATGEYTAVFGGTAPQGQAAVITSINRINSVYEIDLAIRLNLVSNICYTNGATDPYTNNNGVTMLSQNQTNTDATVGNANYDMGHVFSTGGGGVASLAVVGITGSKARGVTGSPSPVGDAFDIDYVAHEMGHQWGANHSFNGTTGNCGGGNRSAGSAYEPGSGSTIMAYAGICGAEDLQPNSDPYFHYKSMESMLNHRNVTIPAVGTSTTTANLTPTVNAGADFTIPQSTPFKLTAVGSDPNGDILKYCWEQYDLGTASPPTSMTNGPIFRSLNPTTSPIRFLPTFSSLLSGAATPWEVLPTVNRNMTWRCTVRDNFAGSGGYATDTALITVSGSAFTVTSPNTAVSYAGGSSQTVTWTVGGGSVAPNVNIYLSTNGGTSYSTGTATLLLANTPNDGSQSVTIPSVPGTTNRIIVEGAGNIFFDVSNVNFTITASNPVPAITTLAPSSAIAGGAGFNLVVTGSNFINGSTVRWNGASRTTTFNSSTQLTAAIPASDILTAGTASITVFTGTPGGGTSNALNFTINNPVPGITSLSPSSAVAAGPGFSLTVNGSNFVSGSVVNWNGSPRTTSFVSSTQLTATILASDIATVGNRTVTVFNPTPGGGTTSGLTFTVNPIEVDPSSLTLVKGVFVSGSVSSVVLSDDVRYRASTGPVSLIAVLSPKVQIETTGTTGAPSASQINVSVESQGTSTGYNQSIAAWNFSSSSWVNLRSDPLTLGDTTRTFSITSNASQYLSGGQVRLRVQYLRVRRAPAAEMRVDRIHWSIHP